MIKLVAKMTILIGVLFSILMHFLDFTQIAVTNFIMVAIVLSNYFSITYVVRSLIQKKSIALPVATIILKYPLIIAVIILVSRQSWFHANGLLSAILIFVISIVIANFVDGFIKNSSRRK